jgi:hypothetical protein
MIEQNCFPPIDQWRCPIYYKEINMIEEDEQSQWEEHLISKHNVSRSNFNNVFPFLIYGEFYIHQCYFDKEQDDYTTVLNEFQGDWDIDEKCTITMCSMQAGFGDKVKEHINKMHMNYKQQSMIKLPPFWSFLKIYTPDKSPPNFLDFLNITKHPW